MDAVLTQVGAMPALVVGLFVGVLMFLDASPIVGLLLPGDLMVIAVVANNAPGEAVLAVVGVVVGTMASWSLFFAVGRMVGPRLRDGRLGRWVGRKRWDTAEEILAGRGARALTVVQFLPVLNSVVPMVAGVLGMRYRHFVRYALPGTTVWAVFFGVVGVWAGRVTEVAFGESKSLFAIGVFSVPGLIAGTVMLMIVRRELAARRAAAAAAAPAAGASRAAEAVS